MKPNTLITAAIIGISIFVLFMLSERIISTGALPPVPGMETASTTPVSAGGAVTAVKEYLAEKPLATTTIVTKKGKITAFVVDSPETRTQGLSGRPTLGQNEGMLFVFPTDSQEGFWMKDMYFPIDVVWMNASRKVIGINIRVATSTYPHIFNPPGPVRYVLELNAGQAQKLGIATGTVVKF